MTAKDDTPRAFSRLIAFTQGIKPICGLDDGHRNSKKRKRTLDVAGEQSQPTTLLKEDMVPKIKPGERMSEFAARVDAALPVSGLIGKGGKSVKNLPGVKGPQTKTEKRMQRMQKQWREAEARRKDKLEEDLEEAEDDDKAITSMVTFPLTKKTKRGKKRKEGADDDNDLWAEIGKARNADSTSTGLVGLHDVVQAPPQFKRVPKEKFRVMNGAKIDVLHVPSAAGSLRRREELGQARQSVVEGYREMMKARRETVTVS